MNTNTAKTNTAKTNTANAKESASATPAPQPRSVGLDVAYIAVFAALIWVAALLPPIPVGTVGVPITVQTLMIGLTGMVLGGWRGFAAALLYVVLGLIGLPVFSGGRGGLGVMAGPSAGYIIAFPLFALLVGLAARAIVKRFTGWKLWALLAVAGIVTSFLTVHPLGIAGIAINAQLPLDKAFIADLPFWPGDVVKNLLAAALAVMIHRAFPTVLVRR